MTTAQIFLIQYLATFKNSYENLTTYNQRLVYLKIIYKIQDSTIKVKYSIKKILLTITLFAKRLKSPVLQKIKFFYYPYP